MQNFGVPVYKPLCQTILPRTLDERYLMIMFVPTIIGYCMQCGECVAQAFLCHSPPHIYMTSKIHHFGETTSPLFKTLLKNSVSPYALRVWYASPLGRCMCTIATYRCTWATVYQRLATLSVDYATVACHCCPPRQPCVSLSTQ